MAIITTTLSERGWSPDVTFHAPGDAVPSALILQTSMVAANVEGDAVAVHAVYVDDAEANFVGEGESIDEATPDLASTLVYTGKISQLIRVSREQMAQENVSAQLAASVTRAVTRAANQAYVSQPAPTGGDVTPPAGLLNVPGIVDLGTVGDNLDALVDGLAILAENYAAPTHFVLAPSTWAEIQKLKAADDSNVSLIGAGTTAAEKYLLSVPVLVDPAVPAGKGLIIDQTAIVSAAGPVQVATSEHLYFNSDSIAIRCTWRFGATVVRPERLGVFQVDIDDGS